MKKEVFRGKYFILVSIIVFLMLLVCACTPGGWGDPPSPSSRSGVALFINNTYVDYSVGNSNSEASNLQADLDQFGIIYDTFTGITASDFTSATNGKKALLIPELENGNLNAAIDDAARNAIAQYVNDGGTLIIFCPAGYDYILDLLNSIFGWSLADGGDTNSLTLNTTDASGTSFASGPTTLPYFSYTSNILLSSLPADALAIYTDDVTGDAGVVDIPYGSGHVIIMGWDWYNAAPVGSNDSGWLTVLQTAINL